MGTFKKRLAMLLAVLMLLSLLPATALAALSGTESQKTVVETETESETEAKSEDEVEPKSEDEVELKSEDETEAKSEDEVEAKSEDEVEAKSEDEVELKSEDEAEAKSEDETEAKSEDEADQEPKDEAEDEEYGIMPASLLPLDIISGNLDLSDYLPGELEEMDFSTIWEEMTLSSSAEKPAEPSNVMWEIYSSSPTGDYQPLPADKKINMRRDSSFYLMMIVGDNPGDQLDSSNKRYRIYVTVPDLKNKLNDLFTFKVFDTEGQELTIRDSSYSSTTYYFAFYLSLSGNVGEKLKTLQAVFNDSNSYGYKLEGLYSGELTEDQLASKTPLADCKYDLEYSHYPSFTALLSRNGGTGVVSFDVEMTADTINVSVDEDNLKDESGVAAIEVNWGEGDEVEDVAERIFILKEGYAADKEYTLTLDAYGSEFSTAVDRIECAVVGNVKTLEEAKKLPDIKQQLFADGYTANFSKGVEFTIFDKYGDRYGYRIITEAFALDYIWVDFIESISIHPFFNDDGENVLYDWDWDDEYADEHYADTDSGNAYKFILKEGLPANGKYRITLEAGTRLSEKTNLELIDCAVVGHYAKLTDAKKQNDIKGDLFSSAEAAAPGYAADYSKGVEITVFDILGEPHYFHFVTEELVVEPEPSQPPSTSNYFYVSTVYKEKSGSSSYNEPYDMYRVRSNLDDTGDVYLTIFIKDGENAIQDGTEVYPVFSVDSKATVYLGDEKSGVVQHSGVTPLKFESGKAFHYTVTPEDKEAAPANYYVTFITPQSGPQLYVDGMNVEETYDKEEKIPVRSDIHLADLTSPNKFTYDILVSNVGDAPLEDLYVKLEKAENVQLDDYWTVDEQGVKTLAPFTTVERQSYYSSDPGELPNLAKIRLRPILDDEGNAIHGVISGYLVIGAKGQDEVRIKLSGLAGIPEIVTETVVPGVKYVPYASLIQTNNVGDPDAVYLKGDGAGLPGDITFYPDGEVYGMPKEDGEFSFTVELWANSKVLGGTEDWQLSKKTFTLEIALNKDDIVWNASDPAEQGKTGYAVLDPIGVLSAPTGDPLDAADGSEHYLLEEYAEQTFRSEGEYGYYMDFYLDGNKLTDGTDYQSSEGSTVITIFEQTLENAGEGTHTISAEFHENKGSAGADSTPDGTLKRSAQNYTLKLKSATPEPEDTPKPGTQTPKPGTETPKPGTETPKPGTPTAKPGTPTSKPGTNNGGQSGNSGSGASDMAGYDVSQGITLQVNVVDAQNAPMANVSVELHSTPQTAMTGAAGSVTFNGVSFGQHTIYVSDASGNKASKSFNLTAAMSASLNGGTITAVPGSLVRLNLQLNGAELTFLSVEGESPETGDSTPLAVSFALLAVSVAGLALIVSDRRKKAKN